MNRSVQNLFSLGVGFLFVFLAGCLVQKDWHKKFDVSKAWNHLQKQVDLGPRPSGSKEAQQAANLIEEELRKLGLRTVRDEFVVKGTPRGNITFRNIIATTGTWPLKRDAIILASHYDTKWLPKIHFVGANDGASSTGCLLELARVLSRSSSPIDIVFIFFDGEEAMDQYTQTDGIYGSRKLVAEMKANGSLSHVRAMILLDMIGDKDLRIMLPSGDPTMVKAIFKASEELGTRDHFTLLGVPMLDDHQPFQQQGVPCIDLIDFEYGPHNAYWHTENDVTKNLSPESLGIVGKTVLKMLEDYPWPEISNR